MSDKKTKNAREQPNAESSSSHTMKPSDFMQDAARESPNDPKLSDGGGWHGACPTAERTKTALNAPTWRAKIARAVTAVAVRCIALVRRFRLKSDSFTIAEENSPITHQFGYLKDAKGNLHLVLGPPVEWSNGHPLADLYQQDCDGSSKLWNHPQALSGE